MGNIHYLAPYVLPRFDYANAIDQGITKMETPLALPFRGHPPQLRSRTPALRVSTAPGCRHPLLATLVNPP